MPNRTERTGAKAAAAAPKTSRRVANRGTAIEPAPPPVIHKGGRSDSADAFFPDPGDGPANAPDDLAETLAEDFLQSATTGSDVDDEVLNQVVPEEIGGPFVETTANEEFAADIDESNPEDATVEARPMAVSGVVEKPRE
jgi:hypothetical protein